MSRSDLVGRVFDGYRLVDTVASGDDEILFQASRVRGGETVWVRTARVDDVEVQRRLEHRYEAEMEAARRLASVGAILPVRETIQIEGALGLVTDVPRGESLNEHFASESGARSLKTVLPWFRKLMTAMEAAHEEGAAHGSLQGRAVYLDDSGRVTVCGVASMTGEVLERARLTDVRALAAMLYRASTGQSPKHSFPDTGMPPSPDTFVPDYPGSLGRFLRRRLADDDDDPVVDAGMLRRSIDALEVDPAFRKAAGLSPRTDDDTSSTDVHIERGKRRDWRGLLGQLGLVALFVGVSVIVTFMVMQVRVEQAWREGRASVTEADLGAKPTTTELTSRERLWRCLHEPFADGGARALSDAQTDQCLRQAPTLHREALAREAARIRAALQSETTAVDWDRSLEAGFEKLFGQGAQSVGQEVEYRLKRHLPLEPLEKWISSHRGGEVDAVLLTLQGREGPASEWAARTLSASPPEGDERP